MALKEGKVDLAVVSASCNISSPLKMRRVLGYQDILIGGTKYQELKGKRISLEKLSEYPWISLTSESITRYAFCVTKCQQKKILAVYPR